MKLCIEHLYTEHNYTNTQRNLQILHKVQKDPKLNTQEKFELRTPQNPKELDIK